jgi:hypothetical protein
VLSHVFRSVGAKYLPVSGNVLIHFDSHPDLALPYRLNHTVTSPTWLQSSKNIYALH